MSDPQRPLEAVLSEAQQARTDAEAAARRAEELGAEADAARQRLAQEHQQRRRAWAQGVVDAYETDLGAADAALAAARDRFATAAVGEAGGATAAYLAWAEEAARHYTLQVRAATVAPELGLEASPAEYAGPPPFSQALDAAIDAKVAARSQQIRDEAAAEIRTNLDDTGTSTRTVSGATALR